MRRKLTTMETNKMAEEIYYSPDYDSVWKETLRDFLKPMISSVLPDLYADLDENEEPIFLDKEANDITLELSGNNDKTTREVDLLVDLPLKNEERGSVRILLHCEVQGKGGNEDLNYRMYCYKSLLVLRYKKPIVALAIITQPLSAAEMSGEYRWSGYGTEDTYKFNVVKTFEADEKLAESDNPFDMAQLAVARAWRARNDEFTRLGYIKEFVRLLNDKGWEHGESMKILKFLETMAKLRTPELKEDYIEFLKQEKKEVGKAVLMIEEMAMQRGEQRGEQRGKLEVVGRMAKSQMSIQQISALVGMPEAEVQKAITGGKI